MFPSQSTDVGEYQMLYKHMHIHIYIHIHIHIYIEREMEGPVKTYSGLLENIK